MLTTSESIELSQSKNLYKSLSLLLSSEAGIPIPESILIAEKSCIPEIKIAANDWELPFMVRMDYSHLSEQKPVGGILIDHDTSVEKLSRFLFSNDLYPLWSPGYDRFTNIYSVGIVIQKDSEIIEIESVGEGFDAGDIRLGAATTHEQMRFDLIREKVVNRRTIDQETYTREVETRRQRICALRKYQLLANSKHQLYPSNDVFSFHPDQSDFLNVAVLPTSYNPLSRNRLKNLGEMAWTIQQEVLPCLPKSKSYVASFSLIPSQGWLLWDIYGHWYSR